MEPARCDSVASSVFPAVTRAGPVFSTVHAEILHLQSRLLSNFLLISRALPVLTVSYRLLMPTLQKVPSRQTMISFLSFKFYFHLIHYLVRRHWFPFREFTFIINFRCEVRK